MKFLKALIKSMFTMNQDHIANEAYLAYMRAEYKNEAKFMGDNSLAARTIINHSID